ncbi:MAG: PspA/IM30 family protein [Sphingomonadales bacterium]
MGTISRVSDIINSNIHAILDRAEQPEKVARLMIVQIQESIADARAMAARTIADRRSLERRLGQLDDLRAELQTKAEKALSEGHEDMARTALLQKIKLRDTVEEARLVLADATEAVAEHDDQIAKLRAKLGEARDRYQAMGRARRPAPRPRPRPRPDEALDRMERLEKQLDGAEGEIEAYDLGKEKTLEAELADLEVDDEVLAELAALKKSRKRRQAPKDLAAENLDADTHKKRNS